MTDTLTSDTVDAANDPFGVNVGDAAPTRCIECGNGFEVPPGPGRKSKKCPDCRSSRTGSANKGNTAVNAGGDTGTTSVVAARLEKSINGMAAMTAMLLSLKSPTDAAIVARKTPPLAKALGAWGSENKTVKRAVEGAANSMAAISVMFTAFDLIWSLLANHGIVPGAPKTPAPVPLRAVPDAPQSTLYTTEGS